MTAQFVVPDRSGRCSAELWLEGISRDVRGEFVECGRPEGHAGDHVASAPIGRSLRKGEPERYTWRDGDPR